MQTESTDTQTSQPQHALDESTGMALTPAPDPANPKRRILLGGALAALGRTADSAYVQRRAWPGSSNRKGSRRSFLSSTSPIGRTVRSPTPTSPSIPNAAVTCVLQARNWSSFGAPTQPHEAASRPRGQGSIAPVNWIAKSASSKRNAARTRSPARSRGICTKTLETSLALSPRRPNTRLPVGVERKSRCYSPTSSESFASRACA